MDKCAYVNLYYWTI